MVRAISADVTDDMPPNQKIDPTQTARTRSDPMIKHSKLMRSAGYLLVN